MAGTTGARLTHAARRAAPTEARWVRYGLITIALAFLGLFLALPLAVVFAEALAKGVAAYAAALVEPDAVAALKLVGSSRVDLQACKLEYSIVSPK